MEWVGGSEGVDSMNKEKKNRFMVFAMRHKWENMLNKINNKKKKTQIFFVTKPQNSEKVYKYKQR